MIRLLYIARYQALAVLLLLLLALAPAKAQNVVYQGEIDTLAVEEMPGDTYLWELYLDSTVNFAVTPGDCPTALADFFGGNTGPDVQVEWKEPGTYFFKVTALNASGCTENLRIGKMKVKPAIPWAILTINPTEICVGESSELLVTFGGPGPWSMKLQATDLENGTSVVQVYTGITAASLPFPVPLSPNGSTEYTVIEVSNKYAVQTNPSNTVTLTVHPLPQKTPIYVKRP